VIPTIREDGGIDHRVEALCTVFPARPRAWASDRKERRSRYLFMTLAKVRTGIRETKAGKPDYVRNVHTRLAEQAKKRLGVLMRVDEVTAEGFLLSSEEVYSNQAVTSKKTQRYHYRRLAEAGWPVGWETTHPSGAVYLQHFHGAVYNQLWRTGVTNAILTKYRGDHPEIILEGEKPPVTKGRQLPEIKKGQVLPGFVRASSSKQ